MADETFEDPICVKRPPEVREEPYLFLVLEGERPLAGGARYALASCSEVVLARGTSRAASWTMEGRTPRLTISIPDRRMSSTHAVLRWGDDGWTFVDSGSRNGSLVNGRPTRQAVLADNDVLQVGHTTFLLRTKISTPSGTLEVLDYADLEGTAPGLRTLSPPFAKDLALLAKVASSHDGAVLLLGETGTGKEVLARTIHGIARPEGPLVSVNCGAIPPHLVESQLFGHGRGAFSGAVRDEPGFVRAADAGTLFLDEIGDLPLGAQPALLRVLQEGEVVPVGGTQARKVHVRFTSATHRPLAELVARGAFREDLLARLSGFIFQIAPLRERLGDLGLLIAELLTRCAPVSAVDPDATYALLRHRWPQNVRELEKALSLAAALADGGTLSLAHLPEAIGRAASQSGAPPKMPAPPAGDDEAPSPLRGVLIAHLERQRGNVTEVARAMGQRRPQVYRWLNSLKIDPKLYRE